MIASFADKDTQRLFSVQPVARFRHIERAARKKLLMLDAAAYDVEIVDYH